MTVAFVLAGVARADGPPSASPPEAPERITLAEALARARAQHPSLAIARQEIERSEGLLREARAAELPTLIGTGLFTRLDRDRVTSTGLKIGDANQWNTSLSLSVPLLVPTAWSNVNHAKDERNQARSNVDDVSRQLATTVARAYLGVILERRQVVVAERARETARAHFDFARTRLQGGMGTSLDDARAEQELRTNEARVATLSTALARARAALGAALSSDHPLDASDDVSLPVLPDVASATDEAQSNRADVKALRARLVGAQHSRRSVWTLYSPYLVGNALAFRQDLGSVLQPTHGWQAQLLLTLPFYDGGVRTGEARERSAVESEARLALEGALRGVANDVRVAFEVMVHQDEGLSAAREAARLARRVVELAELAYRAGATTNLEVIDAERRARDAETEAELAEDASRQARLELLLATGRFP